MPRSAKDVHDALDSYNCKTNRDENFLLVNNRELKLILFSCISNLRYLCSRPTIYVDGTFEYSPKFFTQLFTLHTIENGHYIPLVFILLPNKTTQAYFEAFKVLLDYCKSLGFCLKPTDIVCDFEKAIHIAVRQIWPKINIIGCRFHLTQSWFRKIQNIGLVSEYKNENSEIGRWLRWTFGLIFLDAAEVEDCFVEDLYSQMPQNQSLIQYADYLVDNYVADDSVFTPNIWAFCSSTTERSTNACESFHSKFNASFYNAHPNIYKFIDILKDVQLNTYIKINSVHLPVTHRNVNYKKRNEYVTNLINLYKNGQITRFNFIKSVCYNFIKK